MKKRNAKIQDFVTGNGAKPLCARFGGTSCTIMASGDDKNYVSLWRLNKSQPIAVLNNQTTAQNVVSEVSSVCFGIQEDEIYSGSSRGSINVWDINSQKQASTLKGHTIAVTYISNFPMVEQKHLILSGSYDTSIKLWDLRQRSCINTFKGHSMQVNCLQVSPDGKWFASGSQDSLIKIWDIPSGKVLHMFNLHEQPVTCLKFNPYDLTLASGSADRTIKYWDLDKFGLIETTKPEATGIQALQFNFEGKILFSAAHESLKVWYLEENAMQLVDNVETNWRGVQDLGIQGNESDKNEMLLGVAINSGAFSVYGTKFKHMRLDPNQEEIRAVRSYSEVNKKKTDTTDDVSTSSSNKQLNPDYGKGPGNINQGYANYGARKSLEEKIISTNLEYQNNFKPGIKNSNSQNLNDDRMLEEPSPKGRVLLKKIDSKELNSGQKPADFQVSNDFQIQNKMLSEPSIDISDKTSIIQMGGVDADGPGFSTFLKGAGDKDKFYEFDMISEMMKDHNKFKGVMTQRLNHIKPILHWWNSGNVRSALNAISMLNDATLIMDVLNMSVQTTKPTHLNVDASCIFLQKSAILIESKFQVHIKVGIQFVSKMLKQFHDEIVQIKTANVMQMVDLAREERIKKYDRLIEEFEKIGKNQRLKKISEKDKQELGELATRLISEIDFFLSRIRK